jgi:hypothetical protein
MAIPFIIVTSCIVIATAYSFHGQADESLLSDDPAVVVESKFFGTAAAQVEKKLKADGESADARQLADIGDDKEAKSGFLASYISEMPAEERKLAIALAKPSTMQLASALEPLLGERNASLAFGVGVLAMAFSSIIILMLINGFAFGELFSDYENRNFRIVGAVLALVVGFCWIWLWDGSSKTYLAIVASTFASMLLPIAYLAFLLLMNSSSLMGDEKPTGGRMLIWNVLMVFSLAVATFAGYVALQDKISNPGTGGLVLGGVVTFVLLMVIGFSGRVDSRPVARD